MQKRNGSVETTIHVHTCPYHQHDLIDGFLCTWTLFFYFVKDGLKPLSSTCCVCVCQDGIYRCLSCLYIFVMSNWWYCERKDEFIFSFQDLWFLLSTQSTHPLKPLTIVRISHLATQWIMVLIPVLRFNYQPNLPDNYVGSAHRSIEVGGPKRRPTRLGTSQRTHACGSSDTGCTFVS